MSFNSNYFKQTNNIFNLKLKPNQFTILSYLIRMSNEAKNCYPSMNNISEMCCVSKSTVVRTIEELENAGYITVNIDNTYNVYTINYDVIENTNNRTEKVKRTRTKKEVKAEIKKPVDSNGNTPIDGQVHISEVETIVKATGVSEEEAQEELTITKSKENISNDVKYTIATINNKKKNEQYLKNKASKINPMSFNNFEAREYDYDSLEKSLLGWDKSEEVEVIEEEIYYNPLEKLKAMGF